MSLKIGFRSVARHVGGWVVRWLEILGQNPSLAREPGLYAWSYLHQSRCRKQGQVEEDQGTSFYATRPMADDPHLNLGVRN